MAHMGNPASITPHLDQLAEEGSHLRMPIVRIQFVFPREIVFDRVLSPCQWAPDHALPAT